MSIDARKIYVCCPAGVVTGGPELLHQLVDTLRGLGHDAYISYYPFDEPASCPAPYRHYDTSQAIIEDAPHSLVIVPELGAHLLGQFKQARGAIWWLSVDNYAGSTGDSWLRDQLTRARRLVNGTWLPRFMLKDRLHFVQSHYAAEFLAEAGIPSAHLSDYLGAAHLGPRRRADWARQNFIAYNPKKGKAITQRLIAQNPTFDFRPIENMTSEQVAQLLATAKIYIDFGNHPGKDRMPREAAMAGCCVITGRRGSAKFTEDIAIEDAYKLDERAPDLNRQFRSIVEDIFARPTAHQQKFEPYRHVIRAEPARFKREAAAIFGDKRANGLAATDTSKADRNDARSDEITGREKKIRESVSA